MQVACSKCHKLYDADKLRSDCPHKEFPQMCENHGRVHCGNTECMPAVPSQEESQRALDAIASEYGAVGAVQLNESLEHPKALCSVLLLVRDEEQLRKVLDWSLNEGILDWE